MKSRMEGGKGQLKCRKLPVVKIKVRSSVETAKKYSMHVLLWKGILKTNKILALRVEE